MGFKLSNIWNLKRTDIFLAKRSQSLLKLVNVEAKNRKTFNGFNSEYLDSKEIFVSLKVFTRTLEAILYFLQVKHLSPIHTVKEFISNVPELQLIFTF